MPLLRSRKCVMEQNDLVVEDVTLLKETLKVKRMDERREGRKGMRKEKIVELPESLYLSSSHISNTRTSLLGSSRCL